MTTPLTPLPPAGNYIIPRIKFVGAELDPGVSEDQRKCRPCIYWIANYAGELFSQFLRLGFSRKFSRWIFPGGMFGALALALGFSEVQVLFSAARAVARSRTMILSHLGLGQRSPH